MTRWRRITVAVITGGLLGAAQAPAFAANPVTATISIAASSLLPTVNHDVLVKFHGGTYAQATISGQVTGASNGEVLTLYAQRFPFRNQLVSVGSITLSSPGGTAPYSFTVTPRLATRYHVTLSQSNSTVATSAVQEVYVVNSARIGGVRQCQHPVCHESIHVRSFFPPSSLRWEMRQRLYPYLGVKIGSGQPKWLYRGAGKARISKPRRLSAREFSFTVHFTFRDGKSGTPSWLWYVCIRDHVSKDGIGLPGHHVCGEKRIRSSVKYV